LSQALGTETRPTVPFLDLRFQNDAVRETILTELATVVDASAFTNGPHVGAFEDAFARYCGRRFGVGVGSGLDALRLGLLALGLEQGDEVIVPAMTFIATIEAVVQAGGVPVLADVREDDYGVDCSQVEDTITPRTAFVLPVHLYGQLADMKALLPIAASHGLRVLEDACQAHGASRDGFGAGTAGAAAAFSFYPSKNLGAMGDAGALVTDEPEVAAEVRALREHGQRARYEHARAGYTARLDTMQAAVLLAKLPWLDWWNAERRAIAELYTQALDGVGDLRLPSVPEGSEPVWHLYVVRTRDPGRLAEFLAERGIATGRHYPQPVHLCPAFAHLRYRPGDFPVAELLAAEALSLPLFPGMSSGQLTAVVSAINDFFRRG
jgi:dTDP-4-amino-4,6-dideoxygalactose transaminase